MEDEHLDTILAMESDEVIKSSVEDLVPNPYESEGIPDNMCDVPFCDISLPLDILKDQFEDLSDSNDDSTLIDDDYFSIDDIDYVEASPPDSELVSLEEVKDYILREKLLTIHLLIDKIESLNDNPTPDHVLKRLMNDGKLRGLELVKIGTKIRFVEILVHQLTLKILKRTLAVLTTRLIEDHLLTMKGLMRGPIAELEVDNHDYNEHRSHKTHKNPSGVVEVG
nr:hypothetical protein [Tanacetum cinerariifolium]